MRLTLCISPKGRLFIESSDDDQSMPEISDATGKRLRAAFDLDQSEGLLRLATDDLSTVLPPPFEFCRELAREFIVRLCRTAPRDGSRAVPPLPVPESLEEMALRAPLMKGLEYLDAGVLARWWEELDGYVRSQITKCPGGADAYLRERRPLWRMVGRVTFHLAENKRDAQRPFAFMATYIIGVSAQSTLKHQPLGRALQEYAGTRNKDALLSLLTPVHEATRKSSLASELVESGEIYQPSAWTAKQAHRFLVDIPLFEEAGLIVKVPNWWNPKSPSRAQVSVKIDGPKTTSVGVEAMLDFDVGVAIDGDALTQEEIQRLMDSADGLTSIRGKWIQIDREKLREALDHWKRVEQAARRDGMTFFEGMRLLAGANLEGEFKEIPEAVHRWTGISAGPELERLLQELRNPVATERSSPRGLRASLRPYQERGVHWLYFTTRLGLGACLADDMGLGKTIQVLSLLLLLKHDQGPEPSLGRSAATEKSVSPMPSLLVVSASLIGNWQAEAARFAPGLVVQVAHPAEMDAATLRQYEEKPAEAFVGIDLVITTYGMLVRMPWLRERRWRLAILDEAQAIKNSGASQTRSVKELRAGARIAMTGTPVENRLSDLWSLFDFLNPGLLGDAKSFSGFAKSVAKSGRGYGPLRKLVQPYILRRLKTDKSVIADLPDKTEVNAYCSLSPMQGAIYQKTVDELTDILNKVEAKERRGVVLAFLMRLKQICNHPSQWLGDQLYDPVHSGKFQRLAELADEIGQRQSKVLVFTQFRELTRPLAEHLMSVFGRPGLILAGDVPVAKRRELVDQFQRDDGPPFFVLSLKAGGTGLNLTAASHVIHFDRWWNPAVENQATDRAFRIGQKKNVLVHKFVCVGTLEERIDRMIADKSRMAQDLLDMDGQTALTEMSDQELLRFVALDIHHASA